MTAGLPTTPRAALLALADENERRGRPLTPSQIRSVAEGYPDESLEAFRAMPLADKLQHMHHHVAGQAEEPQEITAELVGTPTLDIDQQLRVEALQAATHYRIGHDDNDLAAVLATADAFLAWLRGDR